MFNLVTISFKVFVCFFVFFTSLFIGNKLSAQPQSFNFANLQILPPTIYIADTSNGVLVIDGKSFSNLNPNVLDGKNIIIQNYTSVIIRNCYFGASLGAGIEIEHCSNVLIENNFFANNRAGVYARACTNIKVKNNQFINVHSIGSPGQYVQFNDCVGEGNEVSGNVGECFWGESSPEDLISMHISSGTPLSPIFVKDNIFRGGGPSESGGGILAGDFGGNYITIQNNKLFNPGHYGISIASGTGHKILNNDVWSDQKPWSSVGLAVYGLHDPEHPACENVEVKNNRVNFICGNPASCPTTIGQSNNYHYPTGAENCTGVRNPPQAFTPEEIEEMQNDFPPLIFSINPANNRNPEDKVWRIRDDAWNFYAQIAQNGIYRPKASTEADKTIYANATTLSATNSSCTNCTDSNYYHWVQVSGPSIATITNPTSFTCTVSGLHATGVYEFRLEVTDKDGAADADWITVTRLYPATLNGKVALQGRLNPKTQWKVVLKVDFYTSGNTIPVKTNTVTTKANGLFTIKDIPAGTYTIAVKNSHTLKRVITGQLFVAGGTLAVNFGTLLEGDTNNDNFINLSDRSLLINSYNKSFGYPGYDARADLNSDNFVTLADLTLLMDNYNRAGEVP